MNHEDSSIRKRMGYPSWGTDSILFVLPVRGGSGGANSVVQEVAGMRSMGVDAKVATHIRYRDAFSHFYKQLFESGDHFTFFDTDDELLEFASPYQVVVATLWSTPRLIAPISWRWPEKLYVYYIQDYEPWFFPNDPESRRVATESYTLIPNMALMAKTDWICRTVRELHGRHVYRVAPSLDHDVYFPNDDKNVEGAPVRIAAMIRPTTPRRGPLRTLRVLQEISAQLRDEVHMLLFGCEHRNLNAFISRNAPDITLGENFENRGQLTRDGVADLLRDADIFVDLSDYQAFGRTGLEAMACGCAVVLPARGGVYEYAVNGHNCFVADTRSMNEMTESILRLAKDSSMRTEISRNALRTAANFDVKRASLSELSVFRVASATNHAQCTVPAMEFHQRLVDTVATVADVAKVSIILPSAGYQAAADALAQRVLAPLRSRCVEDKVAIREVQSVNVLENDATDVCIVYRHSIRTTQEAENVIGRCQQLHVRLVYGTDIAPSADGSNIAQAQSRLIEAADHIVVSSDAIRQDLVLLDRNVTVVEAAFDEQLWLDGRNPLAPYDFAHAKVRLLVYGTSNVDDLLLGTWRRVQAATSREVTMDVIANDLVIHDANHVPRGELPYAEFIRAHLLSPSWDIALLLADDETSDADQRFLSFAALGLAIVCSNEGAHLPFVRHRENAVMVDNTEDAWTHRILELVAASNYRRDLGQQARLDAESRHGLYRRSFAFLQAYAHFPKTE